MIVRHNEVSKVNAKPHIYKEKRSLRFSVISKIVLFF